MKKLITIIIAIALVMGTAPSFASSTLRPMAAGITNGNMSAELNLFGYCGLYCGACYHYRASFPDGTAIREQARYSGYNLDTYTCQGCRSDVLYIHSDCSQCKIRLCAQNKGFLHCGLCGSFPCQRIEEFRVNEKYVHHIDIFNNLEELKKESVEEWLSKQKKRWSCPSCGTSLSWYEEKCHKCHTPVKSYSQGCRNLLGRLKISNADSADRNVSETALGAIGGVSPEMQKAIGSAA